jgi:2-oxoglutarate dehydrogenase complex dehydrogenase (E1) component-like enzyme
MAHRGRLKCSRECDRTLLRERIFARLKAPRIRPFPADEGDVKYHQGAVGDRETEARTQGEAYASPNPSHLEAVIRCRRNGTRKQDAMRKDSAFRERRLLIVRCLYLVHGDGCIRRARVVVMETLNLAT